MQEREATSVSHLEETIQTVGLQFYGWESVNAADLIPAEVLKTRSVISPAGPSTVHHASSLDFSMVLPFPEASKTFSLIYLP